MSHWHIGHNTPGYLPDNPPECVEGSRNSVYDELLEDAEGYAEYEEPVGDVQEDGYRPKEIQFRVSFPSVHHLDEVFWAVQVEKGEGCEPHS